jgi:hypothetical protein
MRWLKGAVIGMGVLIALGLTVVVVTVVRRSGEPPERSTLPDRPSPPVIGAPPPSAAPRAFGETRIVLPPGAEPEETIASGDRLVVRLRLPDGHLALLLIDARTGERIGLIRLERRRVP